MVVLARTRIAAAAFLGLAGVALGATPALAATSAAPPPAAAVAPADGDGANLQDFEFESLDVEYELTRDQDGVGRARVVETFVAVFPDYDQNRGMQRRIPETNLGAPLHPTLESVTDEAGGERAVDTESEDGYLVVTSAVPEGEYVHGRQTYVFTYTLENVTRLMDNGVDEFYWDVNGEEWAQPFGSVTATVRIDPGLADALTGQAACYQGASGSAGRCDIAQADAADDPVVFEASDAGPLAPYEIMTIAVGFEAGTFTTFDNSVGASPWGIGQLAGGALGVGALGWAVVTRRTKLKDEPGRPTIIAEFDPPPGIDAATAAVLLRRSNKAIPAEVLEQAIGGSVRIIETEGTSGRTKLAAELVDPARADENGRIVLAGLFGDDPQPGATFAFGKQSARFASAAQRVLSHAKAAVRAYQRPVAPRDVVGPIVLFAVSFVVIVGCGVAALVGYVAPTVPIVLFAFTFLAAFVLAAILIRSPLTSRGAELRDHLRGLEQFIDWAEADRIRMLQSPEGAERRSIGGTAAEARPVDTSDPRQMLVLYERLLPFAVVFGQERKWAEQLTFYYPSGSPGWYEGTGPMNAGAFAAGIGSLSASSATSSISSSSGGSSGGGSAGGGGGGGGGGGV